MMTTDRFKAPAAMPDPPEAGAGSAEKSIADPAAESAEEAEARKSAEKKDLRRLCRQRLAALSDAERAAAGAAITRTVLGMEAWQQAETVFLYVSTPQEMDTHALITAAWAAGKRVCVPKCTGPHAMAACEISSWEELCPAAFGLLEPEDLSRAVPPEEIGLAVIPCVGAGRDGSRLGHGGGYYDAFLERGSFGKLCLCPESALFDTVPTETNDIPMDAVISERGIVFLRKKSAESR